MKKNVAVTAICLLAAALIALGTVFGINSGNNARLISEKDEAIASKDREITSLTADADDKAGQIEALTAEAADKAGQIESLTADVNDKAGQIEALTADAAEKAGQIEALTAEAADKAGQIEALTAETAEKNGRIDVLTAEAAAKDEQIKTLTEDVAEKAAQIKENEAVIAEQEARIAEQDAAIADLTAAAAGKDRKISELETASVELQGKVEALTAENAEKDETIRILNAGKEEQGNPDGKQPADSPERLRHTEGSISFTLPASIRYDQGVQANNQRIFSDTENGLESKTAFVVMEIDIGMDVSALGDAMVQLMMNTVRSEVEKMDGVSGVEFEETRILDKPAIRGGFIFDMNGQAAPAYGTVMITDHYAYLLFYASLEKSADEVKAEMLECIGSISLNGGEEPAEEGSVDETGLRFGMTREEVREIRGDWDEEEDFRWGYSIVRYRNASFRGYGSTFVAIFREDRLHLWLNGVQEEGPYGALEAELTEKYGAPAEGPKSVIEVFKALDVELTESELNSMLGDGSVVYRLWHADPQTDCFLMKISDGNRVMCVYGYLPPIAE